MRAIIILAFGLFFAGLVQVGLPTKASASVGSSISADGTAPNDNAMLDVQSPATGDGKGILIPRVSLNQRTNSSAALAGGLLDNSGTLRGGAAQGLIVYQTDGTQGLYFNTSSSTTPAWEYYLPCSGGTMSGALNMGEQMVTNVSHIDFNGNDVSVGRGANGDNEGGTAVGASADGGFGGTALGRLATGFSYGVAVGKRANGSDYGAVVGNNANGTNNGTAIGRTAIGSSTGVAVGASAKGCFCGVAVGYSTEATNYGVAIGYQANGAQTNVAIGVGANAHGIIQGTERIAIGHNVTNFLDDTARIRGDLYLDGGSSIYTNDGEFGSSSWGVKAFTINHPLDPENMVLRHFCLEGPQVWNVYAGNAQLVNGFTVVQLPDYYSALNLVGSEIYGLTPVGGLALLAVGEEVNQNCFTIIGNKDVKVSWTIKVLRNDPGCLEDLRRRPVEQMKDKIFKP